MLQSESTFVDLDLCHSQWLDSTLTVQWSSAAGGGASVHRFELKEEMWLYWNGNVEKKQEARAHVSQPLCGAGPGGITAGH